jgi:hypothetical protein
MEKYAKYWLEYLKVRAIWETRSKLKWISKRSGGRGECSVRVQNGFKWLRNMPEFFENTEISNWIPVF